FEGSTPFRSHLWKEDDLLDGPLVCHQHYEAVDPKPHSSRRRHPVAKRVDEVIIKHLGFQVACFPHVILLLEPGELIESVIQFREAVRNLHPADEQLEPFSESLL